MSSNPYGLTEPFREKLQKDVDDQIVTRFEGIGLNSEALAALARVAVDVPPIELGPIWEVPALREAALHCAGLIQQFGFGILAPTLRQPLADVSLGFEHVLGALMDDWQGQFAGIFEVAQKFARRTFPPNWDGEGIGVPDDLEEMVLVEGLPLGWVPPTGVLRSLLAADTAQRRRQILGRSWRSVAKQCLVLLDAVEERGLREHAHFAKESATTLLAGLSLSSQALSATLLDTVLGVVFSSDTLRDVKQPERFNLEAFEIRAALVLGAISSAHHRYRPGNGDVVPRKFSRHASVHGVGKRQYSRINAVIALMNVTALLAYLDSQEG